MSQTFLKSITIRNFKGCREAEYKFGEKTLIYGPNASGKTTIADAFWWLLFNKDSLGNSKFNIRPLDKEGNRIDNVEIEVAAVLEVDGREIELKKTQKQKWVKKRSSPVKELQGNDNIYEIDGYPKSEKDYKERISEIVEEELFKMLTNPTYFPGMKWKEQRDILMRFVSEVSDYELAKENPQFVLLLDEIERAPSLEDIQNKYAKALKELKKKQAELPVRIDEAERQKVDIDVAELELAKKDIIRQIAENQNKAADLSKQFEEYQKLTDGAFEIKFQINDLHRKANQENEDKKSGLSNKKYALDRKLLDIQTLINSNKLQIQSKERSIATLQSGLQQAREKYTSLSNMEFDETSIICPMCKQEYPQNKADEIRNEFDENKANEIKNITITGNSIKANLTASKADLEAYRKELDKLMEEEKELIKNIQVIQIEYDNLPKEIDVSDSEECKKLKMQLVEKEEMIQKASSTDSLRNEIRIKAEQLNYELNDIERKLAKSELNIQLDERIESLQEEQRDVAQKVANQEKMLYLLEEFIRYKMDKISEIINEKLEGVSFKLFENQINGGLRECCECTVNGVPYSDLNNGHKIVAGLKIIKALQQLYGVSAPIFVDNAEAISDGNMPEMDNQMILLAVSNDKKLRIEKSCWIVNEPEDVKRFLVSDGTVRDSINKIEYIRKENKNE